MKVEPTRRRRDRHVNPIAGDLQIAWPLPLHDVAEHTIDCLRGRLGVVEDRGVDGHLTVDLQLALERLDHVVQMHLRQPHGDFRSPADNQERRQLRIGTGHRVERVERSGTIGHERHAQTFESRISIGGKPHSRLVSTDDRRHPHLLLHGVDRQHKVAGNAERVADS